MHSKLKKKNGGKERRKGEEEREGKQWGRKHARRKVPCSKRTQYPRAIPGTPEFLGEQVGEGEEGEEGEEEEGDDGQARTTTQSSLNLSH